MGARRAGLSTVGSLLPYLWPKGDWNARARVVVAMVLLLAAKGATIYVPIVYSRAVDALTPHLGPGGTQAAMLAVPTALIVAYGILRVCSQGFGELRDAVFASVQQRAARQVALQTFEHLHDLSLRFHLDRQTGALSRIIDRGTAGIQSVLRLAVFNIVPTLVEMLTVTGVLWAIFDWRFALLTFGAVSAYLGFTLGFTNVRVRIRRTMNDTDNEARSRTVDSLLNYETVKYFGNEALEARRFDAALARYERAAVSSQVSLNMLNIGQAFIVAVGLAAIMLLAAGEVASGRMTVGKFVLVNTYLMQLYQPLNFLGFVYREVKQGLVDMEQMFRVLTVRQEVADRPGASALRVGRGEVRVRGRALRLPTGPADPARGRFRRAAGGEARHRRADRGGEVDDQPAAVSLLRRDRRGDPDRRPGHPRRDPGKPARGHRRGAAGHRAVQRHDPLQHRLRPARRDPGGDRAGGATGPNPRFRRRAAGRLCDRRWASAG